MKNALNGIGLVTANIATVYKKNVGCDIPPADLRELVAIQAVDILAEKDLIPKPILSKSIFFQELYQKWNFLLRSPEIQREAEQFRFLFPQTGVILPISTILFHLRDIIWKIDKAFSREKNPQDSRRLKKDSGIYETPSYLAEFIFLFIHHIEKDYSSVLDPASGSGSLLRPFWTKGNVRETFALDSDIVGLLFAEINFLTIRQTKENRSQFHPICGDFLNIANLERMEIIVANPPWGLSPQTLRIYKKEDFPASFKNQADSWALFLEKSIQILEQDRGILAFIIPNTLCLNPNFERMRRFLLESLTILFILNMGEGIFPLVTQPALLIIAKKVPPLPTHNIFVAIFQNKSTSVSHAEQLAAWLPKTDEEQENFLQQCESFNQISFLSTVGSRLEIFGKPADIHLIEKINRTCPHTFGDYITNARGVEIGKRAKVLQCPNCKRWNPPPKWKQDIGGKNATCPHCKEKIWETHDNTKVSIIEQIPSHLTANPQYVREIIVGEQVSKYRIKDHNYIRTDLDGINYKPAHIYRSPKILVRKTGREINAAIDWDGRVTIQVVYMFQLKSHLPSEIPLELLLCLLNSRLLLFIYYHRFGDPEKRNYAHYIQGHLKLLPIPNLKDDLVPFVKQIENIIDKYPKFGQDGVNAQDQLKLDASIDALYELTPEDRELVRMWAENFQV